MPRTQSSNLTTIFQAYDVRHTLDIYLNNATTLKLARGAVVGKSYTNSIRSIGDLSHSILQPVDRMTFVCQNVDSALGFNLASNLRLLDYAIAEYGKQYESLRSPGLIEDIPKMFRGVMANAEATEENFQAELIIDYESLGAIIASRGLSPRCWWTYKNGVECTSSSSETSCPKTRAACAKRGVEYSHGGWEFFELPVSSPPGSGSGGGGIGTGHCFTLNTPIWTPAGDIPIGDFPLGRPSSRLGLVSFNRMTGQIDYDDEILEIWEHEVNGLYTFEFEHATVNVTPEHPFWIGFNRFRIADKFKLNSYLMVYTNRWSKSRLKRIRWNSDETVKVRTLHARKNHTYFANRCAVSNKRLPDDI